MHKIVFFVPESHAERVKSALFDAGAGRLGNYDRVAWQTLGTGQFRPRPGSRPFLGRVDVTETVVEYRVEMLCCEDVLRPALEALIQAHPYEEPAFETYPIITSPSQLS